jgi:hypothetical protein
MLMRVNSHDQAMPSRHTLKETHMLEDRLALPLVKQQRKQKAENALSVHNMAEDTATTHLKRGCA